MKEHIIYEFQIKQILDALRLTANYNDCRSRKSCFDRDVMDSIEILNNVMNDEPQKRVNRYKSKA